MGRILRVFHDETIGTWALKPNALLNENPSTECSDRLLLFYLTE